MNSSVLGRLARHAHAVPLRQFSTSPAAQIDISSLYSKITSFRRKKPKTEVVDPTKIEPAKTADDTLTQESRPRKLTVLGRPRAIEEDWPQVRKFAEFKAWPTRHYRKDLSEAQIDEALAGISGHDLSVVSSRFEAVKLVSQQLKVSIPDATLSTINSASALRSYLLSVARPFDERQPDAVYLKPEDFVGTNVIISDPVSERRHQKKKMRELVRRARAAQKAASNRLLEQTRQSAAA